MGAPRAGLLPVTSRLIESFRGTAEEAAGRDRPSAFQPRRWTQCGGVVRYTGRAPPLLL